MNKRLIVDLSILFLIIGFVLFFVLKKEKQEPDVGTPSIVGTFQYDDYKDRNLIDFPSARFLGPIPNAETAMAQAETIWTEIYGEQVKSKKPYQVFYDEEADVWLVTGTLPDGFNGGVPYIMIRKSDGEVLAIWHDK